MTFQRSSLLPLLLFLAAPAAAQHTATHGDPTGDAVVRRTDAGADGPLATATMLPDIIELRLSGWDPIGAPADPFDGSTVNGDSAHVFRLDLVLAGLINPPGTLGLGGLPYDPFRFGPSPLFGFVELSTDRDEDTGGQLGGAANLRFLANVGRFGMRPEDSIGERAAESGDDLDLTFWSSPQVERSGEDFSLALCGCDDVTLVHEGGDGDGLFEAGETWIVRGRFFQRAAGYQAASAMYGGSAGCLYDPRVNLRFSHDEDADVTTVSLVFALTPLGASQLTGEPVEAMDHDVRNHVSIQEGVLDLIDAANAGGLTGPAHVLINRWEGEDSDDELDPTDWEVSALVGTAYETAQDSLYVWTDVGFEVTPMDLNGDGYVTFRDTALFEIFLSSADGASSDDDGLVDGTFTIANFGPNFSLYDLNGDGFVDDADRSLLPCLADVDGDQNSDVFDLLGYLDLWFTGAAAANLNAAPEVDVFDLLLYLKAWFAGC